MSGDSDEEAGFLPSIIGEVEDEAGEEETLESMPSLSPEVTRLERGILLRRHVSGFSQRYSAVSDKVEMVLNGEYLRLIGPAAPASLHVSILISSILDEDCIGLIAQKVVEYIEISEEHMEERILETMLVGFAYLELYCQLNYTGPELSDATLSPLFGSGPTKKIFENALTALECDGNYCFRLCCIPQSLLISRIILSTLALPEDAAWNHGVYLGAEGDILRYKSKLRFSRRALAILKTLRCPTWLNARAAVVHTR